MIVRGKPQLVEENGASARFKWTIRDFSKITGKKYSEIFYSGDAGWRLQIFLEGNSLSIFLYAADNEMKSRHGWSIDADFSLIVVNQIDATLNVKKDSQHTFNARKGHCGFTKCMTLRRLYDLKKGYVVNNACIVEVIVAVRSVFPSRKRAKTPSEIQCVKQKKNSLDYFKEAPRKNEGSSAQRVIHIDPPVAVRSVCPSKKRANTPSETQHLKRKKNSLCYFKEAPSKNEGSSAQRAIHIDPPDLGKVSQSAEPPIEIHASSKTQSPTRKKDSLDYFEEGPNKKEASSAPSAIHIDHADLANVHQSEEPPKQIHVSSTTESLTRKEAHNKNEGSSAQRVIDYHCASIIGAHGLQIKHQEHANVLEELQLSLEKSAQEASQLRGDVEKAKEENVKVADEFSAAQVKIINLEDELQLLRSENVDLQIQLEGARQAEQNAATLAVANFKEINEYDSELRSMALKGLEQATELACARLKNKLPGFDPSMLANLAKEAFLANEADGAA